MRRVLTLVGLIVLPAVSWAARPVTYAEALRAAAEANPTLASARFSVDQSQASLRGARSVYDPSFRMDGTYNPTSKQEGFFQGFAFYPREPRLGPLLGA